MIIYCFDYNFKGFDFLYKILESTHINSHLIMNII